jgi:hypothetical protein
LAYNNSRRFNLNLNREELKKLLKEKGVKSLDDFNAFMREVSKDVVETLLDGELTDHLGFEKYDKKTKSTDNARNGYTPKTVKSKFGEIDLDVPRDRKSDFEPQVVKKRQKDISGLEEKIISMYAKGMTTRDIQAHIKDLYNYDISPETVSAITDRVLEHPSGRSKDVADLVDVESIFSQGCMNAVLQHRSYPNQAHPHPRQLPLITKFSGGNPNRWQRPIPQQKSQSASVQLISLVDLSHHQLRFRRMNQQRIMPRFLHLFDHPIPVADALDGDWRSRW